VKPPTDRETPLRRRGCQSGGWAEEGGGRRVCPCCDPGQARPGSRISAQCAPIPGQGGPLHCTPRGRVQRGEHGARMHGSQAQDGPAQYRRHARRGGLSQSPALAVRGPRVPCARPPFACGSARTESREEGRRGRGERRGREGEGEGEQRTEQDLL